MHGRRTDIVNHCKFSLGSPELTLKLLFWKMNPEDFQKTCIMFSKNWKLLSLLVINCLLLVSVLIMPVSNWLMLFEYPFTLTLSFQLVPRCSVLL